VASVTPIRRLRHLGHLARRFFGSLSRRPPSADDEAWVASALRAREQAIWAAMAVSDRRHAVEVARRLATELGPDAPRPVVAAALLHDCGKNDAGLGTLARVAATLWIGFAGRARAARGEGRVARYCRHEPIGAAMLAAAGSDPVTVALVGGRADAPPAALATLRAADDSV
jgi:hypothetical protein